MRWAILITLLLPAAALGQAPPRLDELPKQSASWPPAWAAVVRELADGPAGFEKIALERVDKLVQEDSSAASYRLADTVLAAVLRRHLSMRQTPPLADNPAQPVQAELQERLAQVRKDWLQKDPDRAEALRRADLWLPVTPADSPLRGAILKLWLEQARAAADKKDYPALRIWLRRLRANFDDANLDELRKPIQDRAQSLFKEAQETPEPQGTRLLEEALELWPRLPGARDALERRKGTYRTLTIGVPALPSELSPATAASEVERQALALLFESLYRPETLPPLGRRYRPQLAAELPVDAGLISKITLRRDAFWSTGERVRAADVRHTAFLLNQENGLWREFLEMPRLERGAFQLSIPRRQGLLDPLAPLTFWVLPEYYRGRQLQRHDDAEFARAPLGSGPFQYAGRSKEAGRTFARFQANPSDLRRGGGHLREIRMIAFTDAKKEFAKPLPDLILDATTDQLPALKMLGYHAIDLPRPDAVFCLAVNERKTTLASATIRRAMALAIDRHGLLERHFRAGTKHHATANGLFPRQSWAACPAPRVREELFDSDLAKALARKAKADVPAVEWTLKFPAGEPRVAAACGEIAGAIARVLQDAGIKAAVHPVPLPADQLRQAIRERDYDLVYWRAEQLDDPVRLALFFDPGAEALRAGGSNVLGCEDVKLQELIHAAVRHRQFSAAQPAMHAIHAYLNETMPAIPLWQLETHVLAQPALRLPPLDAHVFARIEEWRMP